MSLPVIKNMKDMKEKNLINKMINVGSIMKLKFREMDYKTREGIIRMMSKEVVSCVRTMLGKNNFLVKFEYVQKIEIIASSLPYLCSKYYFVKEVDETIYDLPKIVQGEFLTINGCPVCG